MSDSIIETSQLKKTFASRGKGKAKTVEAVRGIDLSIEKGEIFGLLGPNGAGKTTTMRMLCTLLTPTSGTATLAGFDLATQQVEIREQIGYVSQVGGMERDTTGRENLFLQAKLYNMSTSQAKERVTQLLESLQLASFADRKTSTYSGGQRRIFDLAAGIVHKPQLLFLDEPSTGLDPQNRTQVWEEVKKLRDAGTTIFLTTHYLEEADALCNRVAIVDQGQIVALGTPAELKRKIAGDIISLGFESDAIVEQVKKLFVGSFFVKETQTTGTTLHLYVDHGDENLAAIMKTIHDQSIPIKSVQLSRPTLDDVFLKLTGRSLSQSEQA